MATVPLSGTNIRLLSSVPFNNDYKNTRWFDTLSEQTNYFLAKPVLYKDTEHSFQRIEGQHFVKVMKSIDELWGANYLMFQNSHYNSKWFYAFVTKLEYVQKNVTFVHFQIDVLQTWKFEMDFKPSFVVREHCKLWNDDGTPVINTLDEGLDYGPAYDNVFQQSYDVNGEWKWLVIVAKTPIDSIAEKPVPIGSVVGYPQPLSYYLVPFHFANDQAHIVIDGQDEVTASLIDTYEALYTTENAVNNIVALYVTDFPGLKYSISKEDGTGSFFHFMNSGRQNVSFTNIADNVNVISVNVAYEFDYETITVDQDKYNHFKPVKESKLLMYPYCVTIVDDFRGNRVEFKNEFINNSKLQLHVKGSLGLSNKVSYTIEDYNQEWAFERSQVSDEFGVISNAPNDVPILTDMLSAYLQGNRNSLENQKSAIMFNGTIGAMTGGMVGASQSMYWTGKGVLRANPIGIAAAGLQTASGVGGAVIELQGLQAKLKDINNTPPQIVNMGSNNSYDFGNRIDGVFVIKKQIKDEYIRKLEDFFKMFGYKVNEVKMPNFHTRQNWNYVETKNCNILANMNNDDLRELKSVFDNGITFWHTDDIGNYALENEVISNG